MTRGRALLGLLAVGAGLLVVAAAMLWHDIPGAWAFFTLGVVLVLSFTAALAVEVALTVRQSSVSVPAEDADFSLS